MNNYDVLIVGGGVIGSAIARELSHYQLKIGVLEKNPDVCLEMSGRNSAVIHGGFAYEVGTQKAALCVEGCLEFDKVAKELDVPFKRTGKVLVGNTPEDMESLKQTMAIGEINGAVGLELIDEKRLKELVPTVEGKFAMYSPMSGILDPFQYTIGLAENAAKNGVKFNFNSEVTGINPKEDGSYGVETKSGSYTAKWIINAAGLGAVKISEMLGIGRYEMGATRGHYIVLDKNVGHLLPMPVYPVPSTSYMGIHVTPTVEGNVTVGPDADRVQSLEDYGVEKRNMEYLVEDASTLWPHIHRTDFIRNYAGIQPTWLNREGIMKDFVIEAREEVPNTVNLVGIESPGLTSALPIARKAVKHLVDREKPSLKDYFDPTRERVRRFSEATPEEQQELILENPDYGEIICRCESVSKAEVLDAIHNPLGVNTMVGIKYRTRSMMGRCQGGYCQMRIAQLLQQEKGLDVTEVLYAREESELFTGRVR
ncbi:NAD(P)/FAD-dependent oxidoreductase [Alkalibacter mobilis]|uniref:NAD(P)/FAD-dependent oxidoreductase n=1 Tax=Alkalibacter mobilis TaxID=2787712 RepID=UPI00189FD22A|nr:NAD(P)/FAD-dependent oxidoreductase [Alkalibacter mobilis]MBF7097294.1 NAD(P)/FAD-dependent oxidoreductase [Alkalibacter mobilis]